MTSDQTSSRTRDTCASEWSSTSRAEGAGEDCGPPPRNPLLGAACDDCRRLVARAGDSRNESGLDARPAFLMARVRTAVLPRGTPSWGLRATTAGVWWHGPGDGRNESGL